MKKMIIIVLLVNGLTLSAQIAPHKYFIEFTDKNQNPYSLNRPEEFLTQRAIERRQMMGIGYEENDLPVTPAYIQAIQNIGALILNPTKWLNGTTIYLADTTLINAIKILPFVKSVVKNEVVYPIEKESFDKFLIVHLSIIRNNSLVANLQKRLLCRLSNSYFLLNLMAPYQYQQEPFLAL